MVVSCIRTFIPDLDEILYGGIPERNIVLLFWDPGTGKSIAAKQFLYNGMIRGEGGVFVALEEYPVSVRRSFRHFGWDISKFKKKVSLQSWMRLQVALEQLHKEKNMS